MTDISNTSPESAKSGYSIGAKLAFSLAFTILVGVAAMVIMSTGEQRNSLTNDASSYREIMTRQLGAQMTGGLRWKKVSAIQIA